MNRVNLSSPNARTEVTPDDGTDTIQSDPELLKQAAEMELDAGKHDFILLTEEELEEYIKNHGGSTQ